ncbi:S8 family serine peptidase [Homoserinibacter sp. YIM 151385]|uniref:S8 family serine peptidase n=1 Tax=Homoserinibacter sp. YIM 151385 TaxID=2985506 RepID=UPI0022F06139|nr:S8 family serine peptidase [Homoserinibacter sp. YIM 151385]WBU38693.1 S8 family serine peptidase [Homoserinibacter sp. YIM 151385]
MIARRRAAALGTALALLLGTASASTLGAAPAVAAEDTSCSADRPTSIAGEPPGLQRLGARTAWQQSTGEGVRVAIVDSGVDTRNAHLRGAVADGVSTGASGSPENDLVGHGTAIGGIIAAREVEGSGVVGVAPDAELLAVRAFEVLEGSNDERIAPSIERIAAGISWAAEHGADVINVSLSVGADDARLRGAVQKAQAAGALVVASAGNRNTADQDDPPTRFFPAEYPGVLGVAAVDIEGIWQADASFAGDWVDVVAPGSQVQTAYLSAGDCILGDSPSSSWATGYVSGAAALVAAAHPEETPDDWAYRLQATALRADPWSRTDETGWGEVRPAEAIAFIDDGTAPGPASPVHEAPERSAAPVAPIAIGGDADPMATTRAVVLGTLMAGVAISAIALLLGRLGARRGRRGRAGIGDSSPSA